MPSSDVHALAQVQNLSASFLGLSCLRLDEGDEESLLSVNYAGFTPVLVEGLKELADKIIDLEHKQFLLPDQNRGGWIEPDGSSYNAVSMMQGGAELEEDSGPLSVHNVRGGGVLQVESQGLGECSCGMDLRVELLEGEVCKLRQLLEGTLLKPD